LEAVIGTATTPDLRDKFIVTAGSAYPKGATGGVAAVTLTIDQIPPHEHPVHWFPGGPPFGQETTGGTSHGWNTPPVTPGWAQRYARAVETGGSAAHTNMPPYYALTYIIKKRNS